MARRQPLDDSAETSAEALITIHDHVYSGILRRRSWSEEHNAWRWSVEISIDDCRVMTSVSADQIQRVRPEEPDNDHG